jgi:hypothetical protein
MQRNEHIQGSIETNFQNVTTYGLLQEDIAQYHTKTPDTYCDTLLYLVPNLGGEMVFSNTGQNTSLLFL